MSYNEDCVSDCSTEIYMSKSNFPPIVTLYLYIFCAEYMSEGTLFCFLRNEHVVLDLSTLLKLAQDGCRRMDYLRPKGTVHWNFDHADLLIDKEHGLLAS